MNRETVDYRTILDAARTDDAVIIFTPIRLPDGTPHVAWVGIPLDEAGATIANSPHRRIRAAQACSLVSGLRAYTQHLGFLPA